MEKSNAGNQLLGGSKEKFIETGSLRIAGHLLQWEDVVIQISNIAMISSANIQLPDFPIWAVAIGCVGIVLIPLIWFAGLLLFALAGFTFYVWYNETQKKKKLRALSIHLNSGKIFSILFQNEVFLDRVLDVFSNIFEDGGKTTNTTYQIDIQNCKIDNESSFINAGKE